MGKQSRTTMVSEIFTQGETSQPNIILTPPLRYLTLTLPRPTLPQSYLTPPYPNLTLTPPLPLPYPYNNKVNPI